MPDNPKETLGEALHNFVDHVKEHPAEEIEAALVFIGKVSDDSPEGNPRLEICSFAGGNASALAHMMDTALREMEINSPGFAECFQALMKKRLIDEMISTIEKNKASRVSNERASEMAATTIAKARGDLH